MEIKTQYTLHKQKSLPFKSSGVKNMAQWTGSFEQWQKGDDDRFIRTVKQPCYTDLDHALKKLVFASTHDEKHNILNNFLELPGYLPENLIKISRHKTGELNYLQKLAGESDMLGHLRIPAHLIDLYSDIPVEDIEKVETILLSKNDLGLWNYEPEYITELIKLDENQLYTFNKLAKSHVEAKNIAGIIKNRNLNWTKTIEKAESLNRLYGEDLREISFYSNTKGENFISADIQLPHRDDKPDWLNFKRINAKLDDDTNPFHFNNSSPNIKENVENIYQTIQKQLYVFTEKDLDKILENIKTEIPNVSEQEILQVMQRLTAFANYPSLKTLASLLEKHNIIGFVDEGVPNIYFKYFNHNKQILPLKSDDNGKFAYIVTKYTLNNPEENEKIKKYIKDKNVIFINLDGWSDGVNLFSDDKKLEELTKRTLVKAKLINKNNPDMTFDETISEVLNKEIIEKMKKIGTGVTTVRIKNPPLKSMITEQMKPYMPSKNLIKSTIESVSNYYTKKDKSFSDLCERISKYYAENINAYSKQSIIESLKVLHSKINDYLRKNNLQENNVYIAMPDTDGVHKSFEIITKMYTDLFRVPEEKIIKISDISDIEQYPENSVFVIPDDVVASGKSILMTGEYMFNAFDLPEDKHILFAPVTASNNGIKYIKDFIKENERENIDDIIFASSKDYKDIKKVFTNSEKKSNKHVSDAFGEEGYGKNGMCTVFPYMDPDNNSSLAGYITKFFVPDTGCLKSKTELIPVIEEKTYLYDIFGINNEASENYPNKINNILSAIKNLIKK